jgi:hypothetical protein
MWAIAIVAIAVATLVISASVRPSVLASDSSAQVTTRYRKSGIGGTHLRYSLRCIVAFSYFHSPNCLHTAIAFVSAVLDSANALRSGRFSQLRVILSNINDFAASFCAGGSIFDTIGLLCPADLAGHNAKCGPLRMRTMAQMPMITVAIAKIMYLDPKRRVRFGIPGVIDATCDFSHRTLPRTTLAPAALYFVKAVPAVSNLSLSVI